jgi:hypothetical protein
VVNNYNTNYLKYELRTITIQGCLIKKLVRFLLNKLGMMVYVHNNSYEGGLGRKTKVQASPS